MVGTTTFGLIIFPSMDRVKIVDYYLSKINDRNFNILQVRQEREKHCFPEEEIKVVVRLIDNAMHRKLAEKAATGKANLQVWLGGVVTLAGVVITVGTYTGLINMGNYFVLAYGPILGGLAIMVGGFGKGRERRER